MTDLGGVGEVGDEAGRGVSDRLAALRHVLAFEPWDGGSHAAVRESIQRHSRHRWTWCTLPARGWRWRLRTGAWTLAERAAERADECGSIDVLFVGGLLSLPDLLAALRRAPWPQHGAAGRRWPPPAILMMHENQAAYPGGPGGGDARDVHLVLTNLASIAAADAVVWNSEWNRRSLAEGVRSLRLRRLDPDPPAAFDPATIARIGEVIWPPVEMPSASRPVRTGDEPCVRVAWPHRWEHDKGPDELLQLARDARAKAATGDGPAIRWALLGERFTRIPPELETFRREFQDDIEHDGFADPAAYRRRLATCDWVLSTARHEFFGIAVVEALLEGCLPWLPNRLSYPELLPPIGRGLSPHRPPADPDAVRTAIRKHLDAAIAPHAVSRLDRLIDRLTAG